MIRWKSILLSRNCSCWKQTMRSFPAVAMTRFRRSAATSATKSAPVTTCQIGPSSRVKRLLTVCASTCTSSDSAAASSSRTQAMVCSASEPASALEGSWTRRVAAETAALAARGAVEPAAGCSPPTVACSAALLPSAASDAGSASAAAVAALAASVGRAALELAPPPPGAAPGFSMPGDFQITMETSPARQTPMVASRFKHAKPSWEPTRTCQCGSKLLSRDAFSVRANSPQ
mmetsp:Transcript_158670/g.485750  ORF Transcript_158670/g.485750 Transcript_158670/m.485750 type:complete len:232 (-) Transcript_158670:134-829(-)